MKSNTRLPHLLKWLLLSILTMSDYGQAAAPVVTPVNGGEQIAIQPKEFTITFTVSPSVQSSSISWLFGSTDITDASNVFHELSSDRLTLTITLVQSTDEGLYTLRATNADGTSEGTVRLSVESEPGFQTSPDDAKVHERLNTTLKCFATGIPTPSITWLFNGQTTIDTSLTDKYFIGPFGNGDFGSLTIYNLEFSDAGMYTCVANNTHSSNTASATLEVQVFPVIVVQPYPTNITAGSTGSVVNCTVRAFPFAKIYWQRNGENITDIGSSQIAMYDQTISQTNMADLTVTSILSITGPVLSTEGNFSCIANNSLVTFEEAFSNIVEVHVQYPPSTQSTTMVTVNQSDPVSFNCSSFGIPSPGISWFSSLDPATPIIPSSLITLEYSSYINGSGLQIQTSSLSISTTNRTLHEANYICRGSNGVENFIETPEESITTLVVQVPPLVVPSAGTSLLGIVTNNIVLSVTIEEASPMVQPNNVIWTYQNITLGDEQIILAGSQYIFSNDRLRLTINDLTHDNEGVYIVTATNEAGTHSLQLTLNIEAAPNITIFPSDTNRLMGDNASFICGATSEPPHNVTWLQGDTVIENNGFKYVITEMGGDLQRERVSVLTIVDTVMNDTSTYTCVVTNEHGTQNYTAHLEVQVPPQLLTIRDNTTDTIIGIVDDVNNISCQYFGSPIPDIVWFKDSVSVDLLQSDVSVVSSTEGFTSTSTLLFSRLDFLDDGKYTCQGRNTLFNLQIKNSSDINLIINQSPQLLTTSGNTVIVNQTQSLNITCMFLSRPIPTIDWTSHGTAPPTPITTITDDDSKYNIFTYNDIQDDGVSFITTTVLEINNLTIEDTLNYTCTATNTPRDIEISNSSVQNVIVQTSPIVNRVSGEIEIGVKSQSIILSFEVSRDVPSVDPSTGISWSLMRENGDMVTIIEDSRHAFDQSRTVLNITDLILDDQGTYTVTASNIIGNDSSTVFLDVQRSPMITNNSGIVRQVLDQDALFKCVAVSEPIHISRWLFNGLVLNTSDKYLIQGNGTISSNLTVFNVTSADEGNYTCIVDNAHGVDEESAQLLVQVPPSIIQEPVESSVLVTMNVTLTCCVSGTPLPSISWFKESQPLYSNTSNRITVNQVEECGTLSIEDTNLNDTASYHCMATNTLAMELSENSNLVDITVQYPPEVFPLAQSTFTRNESDLFTVECSAFGVPLPTIYWIPAPFDHFSNNPSSPDQTLSGQNVQDFLASVSGFNNVSRLLGASSRCQEEGLDDDCSAIGGVANNCTVSGSLCSVPCAVDITSNSTGVDSQGRAIVTSTLSICGIMKSDELTYSCVAVNNISNVVNTAEGAYTQLVVQVPPTIVSDEAVDPVTAFRDRNVTLNFIINDASPDVAPGDITWTFQPLRQMDIRTLSANDTHYKFSNDRRNLTIVGLGTNDAGTYTLTATNPAGIRSESIGLDVQALPDVENVSSAMDVRNGDNVTLQCFADGSPIQDVTWTLTDLARNETRYLIRYVIDNPTNRTGHVEYIPVAQGVLEGFIREKFSIAPPDESVLTKRYGELTIYDISPFEAGQYNCRLNNTFGSESRTIPIRVQLNPRIDEPPSATTCVAGKPCQLSCLVEGVPSPTITFTKDGTPVQLDNRISLNETILNYTHTGVMLMFASVELSDYGQYICNGSNALVLNETTASEKIRLTVNSPPEIEDSPLDTVGNSSFGASFTCNVSGFPAPSVRWSRNEPNGSVNITQDEDKFKIQSSSQLINDNLFIVTSTLMIMDLNVSDELTYQCTGENRVENAIGAVNFALANLTVQVPPSVNSLNPLVRPINGTGIQLSFSITGDRPPVLRENIEWMFVHENGTEIILNPACVSEHVNCSDERYSRYNFSSDLLTLNVYSVRVADYGLFILTAAHPAGIRSESANVSIIVPPKIFVSSNRSMSLSFGANFTLYCNADGIPRPTIQWRLNSITIDGLTTNRYDFNISVLNQAFRPSINTVPGDFGVANTLTVTSASQAENGMFTCQATNSGGGTILLDPPYNVAVEAEMIDYCENPNPCQNGGTCTQLSMGFLCDCFEGEEVRYGGPTCESEYTVTVPPTITTQPDDQFVNLFDPAVLKCSAEGTPDPAIIWLKNDEMQGTVGDTLRIPEVGLNDRGNYSCMAKNAAGVMKSRNAIVNAINIIQYEAIFVIRFDQITSTDNLTEVATNVIQTINNQVLGSRTSSGETFFSITARGNPVNNSRNVTLPILVTIRLQSDKANDELRQSVEKTVASFDFELEINDGTGVRPFDRCQRETTEIEAQNNDPDLAIKLNWPDTILGMSVTLPCPCNLTLSSDVLVATRTCSGSFETGAEWNRPMQSNCDFSLTARRLCRLANLDEASEILSNLGSLTSDLNALGSTELTITSALLTATETAASGNTTLTDLASDTIDNTLRANRSSQLEGQRTSQSQSRTMWLLQNLTANYTVPDGMMNTTLVRETFAVSIDRSPATTADLNSSQINPNIASVAVQADITSLTNSSRPVLGRTTTVFANDGFFLERNGRTTTASSVLDFTILGYEFDVYNLQRPINFTFDTPMADNNPQINKERDLRCVFWDQEGDDGFGAWSDVGVTTGMDPETGKVMCSATHLTSFSILLDVAAEQTPSPLEDLAFSSLTYIGICVSVICLLFTIFTYLYSPRLRKSDANKLLLNLCFALLGLYLTFFLASQGQKITVFVCAIVGALLHYFLLVVFFVMAAEAIDLFIKLVIVLGSTIQHYLTKAIIIAWILPVFIVPFTISPHYEGYVHDHYCGATGPALYVGVLVPFFVVYIFNITIFFIIMISLLKKSGSKNFGDAKKKNRKQETKQQCRVAFTISILFGLGWGFGLSASQAVTVDAIRIASNILFTVFIAFQGFFIFLLYIVLSPNAKKEWKLWILRKGDRKGEATSSVGGTSSRSTASTAYGKKSSGTYRNNKAGTYANRRGGTLYHNVYSSQSTNKTQDTNLTTEFSSGAFESESQMLEELKYNLDQQKTFTNPLDEYEDTFSMLSDPDAQSIGEVAAVSAFPNPKPSASQEDNGVIELSLTVEEDTPGEDVGLENNCTTLDNPFLYVKGKQMSVDGENLGLLSQESTSNQVFSFDMSQSQGLSDGTGYSDHKNLIKPTSS